MTCPDHGDRQKLLWDSEKQASRRNPYRQDIHGLPRIVPLGQPNTTRPLAHCMLAYWDVDKSYYIYTKCIYAVDLVMICNALVSTRAAAHIQIYEINRVDPVRVEYIDRAHIILFDGLAPAFTRAEQLTNFFLYFRQLVEARGYTFRRYYDDREADLPVTSHTPWRPKIPKGARGWDEILNLRDKSYNPSN